MDNIYQNNIKRLQRQLDIQNVQLEQEARSRQKAKERIDALADELKESKNRQALDEAATDERIRFDVLLSETSAHFINLPSDQVDNEIENVQRHVCECLGLHMCSVWQWADKKPDELILTHLYRPLGGPPIPKWMDASKNFPWSFQQIMANKMYVINSIDDLPAEAASQLESWRYYDIKSSVGIPLKIGDGVPFGVITFHDMQAERIWSDTIVKRLQLVAQIFANALARKRSYETLRESESRLSLATDAAGAGLWIMDIGTQKVWVSAKLRELFNFTADEEITYQNFFEKIHPDDRYRVNIAVKQALQSGENLQTDYRITLQDGRTRWIGARGQRHLVPGRASSRFLGVSFDITERKLLENELRENLHFETLLTEISAHFVNLPPEEVDSGIQEAQRRVCECLNLDVSALWQWTVDDPDRLIMTHLYRSIDGPPVPENLDANDFFPWCQRELRCGRIISVSSMENLPPEASQDQAAWNQFGVKTSLTIPLKTGNRPPFGGISFNDMRSERTWSETLVKRLQLVAQIFANALERKRTDGQLLDQFQEIAELKKRLENENVYLKKEIQSLGEYGKVVGQSHVMKDILAEAGQVAATDSTVLILGETGTGKEMLARTIHQMSARKDRPMVTVNCASLPPTLIESELFGRERGAYTGAMTQMIGRFEIADGATLFLDEIGELPMELQSKLLRVLEEGVFERLGSTKPLHVNVRIIAATNRDIENEMAKGRFRKDLFYRLNVFPLVIPPLRERPEDIPLLVLTFVREFKKRMGKEIESIPKKTMESLQSYPWPGNVRELKNVIEHAMILSNNSTLVVNLSKFGLKETDDTYNLGDMERQHIASVLERTGWRVGGKGGASEILGLKRSTLYSKMKKLGIARPYP